MMVLDFLRKRLKREKKEEGEEVPSNWVDPLLEEGKAKKDEKGTIRVVYEPKRNKRYFARRIKRFLCFILIVVNFIMLVTCFFVEGGIMSPFFFFNTIFLAEYFWRSKVQPLEEWK